MNATGPIVQEDDSVTVVAHQFQDDVGQLVEFRLPSDSPIERWPVFTVASVLPDPTAGRFYPITLSGLMPDGQGGLIVSAERDGELLRIDSDHELVAAANIAVGGNRNVDDDALQEVQIVLGDSAAYALVQRWPGSAFPNARMVAIDPVTLAIVGATENLPGTPNLRIDYATAEGNSVVYGGTTDGHSSQIAPGLVAYWQSAPALETALVSSIADTAWSYVGGNQYVQNAPVIPVFTQFVTQDPLASSPSYTYDNFRVDLTSAIQAKSAHLAFTRPVDATVNAFKAAVSQSNAAFAFVGHSSENSPYGATGLLMIDKTLMLKMDPQFVDARDGGLPPDQWQHTELVGKIESHAKVVFIAACSLGTQFMTLWDIDQTTAGRALIVPAVPGPTDLFASSQAWKVMATSLAQGRDVADAVSSGNFWLQTNGYDLRFQIVGDAHVKAK